MARHEQKTPTGKFLNFTTYMGHASALAHRFPRDVSVDLMPTADGKGWEYYKRSAGRPASTFAVGTAVVSTQFQAYGPHTVLKKTHAMKLKVESFTPNASFPLATSGLTLTIKPRISCDPIINQAGVNNPRCTFTQPSIKLPLRAGASSTNTTFDVSFDWQFSAAAGGFNVASFSVYSFAYNYQVDGSELPAGQAAYTMDSDSADAQMKPQELRCDKNVVTGSQSGCVFPRAAAVYVLDRADATVAEAAAHIYKAQRSGSPGQSALSPGRFSLKPGTRAVMADRVEPQYQGLQREKTTAVQKSNRDAACTLSGSLFNTRPYQGSASCPVMGTPGCQCDEFPFASTINGGAFSPDATSVKGILATHNNAAGGGRLTAFLGRERVLSNQAGYDPFQVEIK